MERIYAAISLSITALFISVSPGLAIITCNTTQTINSNTTLNDDYVVTTQNFNACISIGGSAVVNMAGHTITCQSNTNLCGPAVNIASTGTIRNGNIVTGTVGGNPAPFNVGVQCFSGGAFTDCSVSNMFIQAASDGMVGGYQVDTTVFEDADTCIDSSKAVSSAGFYRQNFCSANTTGFTTTGPSSGTFTIERNFVRAGTGTGIDVASSNTTVQHNIIDATTPISGSGTLSENICADLVSCPEPTARGFTFSLDFN